VGALRYRGADVDPERGRLCDALLELLTGREYPEVTDRQVELAAGLPAGSFTSRFPDLEDCLVTLWDAIDLDLRCRLNSAQAADPEWRQQMRATLDSALAYFAAHPDRAGVYIKAGFFAGERMRRRREGAVGRLAQKIDAGRSTSPLPQPEALLAEAIAGALWHYVLTSIRDGRLERLPGQLGELMYLVVLPYLGIHAAEQELRA
jgi:AcrR family transcriptional regulator